MKKIKKAAPKKKIVKKAAKKPVKKIVKKPVKKAPAKKISKPSVKKPAKKIVKAVKPVKKTVKKVSKPVVKTIVKKPAPAKVAAPVVKAFAKEEALTVAELKEIKAALTEMRDDARTRLKEKKDDMPEAEVGDPIDTASQSLDKEILFELSDNSQMLIDQIEAALRKIDKGIYGSCESCRRVLPKKRIKALPFARYCVNCQTTNESRSY